MRTDSRRRWWRNRSGATAIEYGLLLGMVALLAVGGFSNFFDSVKLLFDGTSERVNQVIK